MHSLVLLKFIHSDKLDSRHEAANSYSEAAQVYKKAPNAIDSELKFVSCDNHVTYACDYFDRGC